MRKNIKYLAIFLTLLFVLPVLSGCDNSKSKIERVYAKLFNGLDTNHILTDFSLPNQLEETNITYQSEDQELITIVEEEISTVFHITRGEQTVLTSIKVTIAYKKSTLDYTKVLQIIQLGDIIDFIPYPGQSEMQLLDEIRKNNKQQIGLPINDAANNETRVQNVLIIPINFNDYSFSEADLSKLDLAFFGSSIATGYESVQSYYYKSSYGQIDIQGTILEPYDTERDSSYYSSRYRSYDVDQEIMRDAVAHYDNQIDYSLYDTDSNGVIDAIYLIYAKTQESSSSPSNLWWAWQWEYNQTDKNRKYDNVKLGAYIWASKDFIYEPISYYQRPYKYVNVNSSIYIHETGHLFGLEDYYDTNSTVGPKGGLGGLDMMDANIGDHSSYSKIVLGWTTPQVVYTSIKLRINPFESTGEVILIPKNWNNSYFDEYLLIDYYTPNGLNYIASGIGLYSIYGIRIYHISSEVGNNYDGYTSILKYDNSDTDFKLIKLLESNNRNLIENMTSEYLSASEANGILFRGPFNFDFLTYTWNDGTPLNFTINILALGQYADIEIIYS